MQFPSIKKALFRSLKNNSSVKALHSLHYTEIVNKRAAEQNCLVLLETCNSFIKLTQVHAHLFKLGLQNNPLVLTKFTSTSSNLNSISYAASIILSDDSGIYLYDTFLFNTIIRAYAQTKDAKHNAVFIYCVMLRNAILPNKFTFPFLLKASAGLVDLNLGKQFARNVFDRMTERSPVSWSALIGGYARLGQSTNAVGLFREMQISGVRADEITMVSVLSACADLGALELGKWADFYIEKEGISRTEELCNALIDMFAKCGDVDEALRVFHEMKDKTTVSWTSVIVGLAMHGRGTEAVALFEEMKNANVTPDGVSFIGLLSACSHAGLVEEGSCYFESMATDFAIVPKIEHYGCMVDLFSRAGLVNKAFELVRKMPFEPNPVIYRTLINACRAHGELELGENITKQLIGDEPSHGSNYVLLSNIYAKMSRWEKKSDTRRFMEKKGLRKIPGCSMLELNNKIYEFVAGDRTHKYFKEIYTMLDEMGRKLKEAGYVPIVSDVLLDINEEDKEDAVNRHSEKLAIAFALLNSPAKTPIRVVKNLRVCGDCHSATKFISKVYDREIVVRDRNRFHHFKDGSCSCKDFW
ncbi:hypothetical protein AQUCO_02000138v1 [Aquilegia coerulea]|uniref:DYW domain-containing protein n=1 Tax=Aquilegia coerulea TaxID=218851 RepID=A0A2G5DG33_AQUCA|nr:hypothetical protein AQUCO_02000138v1 [Aquilegia coerulea]